MSTKAIFFGSIGTLAETSDVQRRAYNKALAENGLAWVWDEPTYRALLSMSGGKERLRLLGAATGQPLAPEKIDAIHQRKTALACEEVRRSAVLRPGVSALLAEAAARGLKVGIVTSTYRANIDAILDASGLAAADFRVIVDRGMIAESKPAPEGYRLALGALEVEPGEAIAIEDTAVSLSAARRAGIRVIATPGAYSVGQDFSDAGLVLDSLADAGGGLNPSLLAMLGKVLHPA